MNEQTEPSKTRLPFEPGDEIIGERDALERRTEHELARVQDKGFRVGGLDRLGEVAQILFHIDDAAGVIAKDEEPVVEAKVDRRRLYRGVVEGIDRDDAAFEMLADGAVGEDHVREPI